jgi:hypothetical protein
MNSKFCKQNFAYWLGVVQSDGYLKIYKGRPLISLHVGKNSLPMFKRFIDVSREIFNIKGSSYTYSDTSGRPYYLYRFGAKKIIPLFEKPKIALKGFIPPVHFLKNKKLFGAYLGGIIDGDGNVRISRPKYPQCYVRIFSSNYPKELIESIKSNLTCSVNYREVRKRGKIFGRIVNGVNRRLEFRVIPKNFDYFDKFIVPFIAIDYKRSKIIEYIEKREGGRRESNSWA